MNPLRFLLLSFIVPIASCRESVTCQVYKKRFYDKETNIIVLDKGPVGNNFIAEGVSPVTGKSTIYTDADGIYNYVYNNLEIGDTLIKAKNNAVFVLKKKEAVVLISYNCLTGIYKEGGVLDTLSKRTFGQMRVDTIARSSSQ